MTRHAIDAQVAVALLGTGFAPAPGDSLVGPAVLRSDALALLYRDLPDAEGRARLEDLAALRIRLLGDRVSRATAWRMAREVGWSDPRPAEYLAVARLQADVLVTADPALLTAAATLHIPTAAPSTLPR